MKQKDLLFLIASTTVLILSWIGFSIYHNLVTSTIPENLNVQIAPLDSKFDTQTLQQLRSRKKVSPLFELPDIETTAEEQTATSSGSINSEITP